MATYVVVRETGNNFGGEDHPEFYVVETVQASSAERAERLVADKLSDDDLNVGVTLRAVPQRTWEASRNTFKAETRRRLLRS